MSLPMTIGSRHDDVPRGQHVFVGLHELIRENAHKLYPGIADIPDPVPLDP